MRSSWALKNIRKHWSDAMPSRSGPCRRRTTAKRGDLMLEECPRRLKRGRGKQQKQGTFSGERPGGANKNQGTPVSCGSEFVDIGGNETDADGD
jgi:hypothetical protein